MIDSQELSKGHSISAFSLTVIPVLVTGVHTAELPVENSLSVGLVDIDLVGWKYS